ncbi:MAG TPA: globin family protein [Candidatus Limnocylindrales bacterium]|nr:globin family protein [Candidatus Limnocylindrales bacterium]
MTPEREQLVRDTWARFEPKAPEYARYFYDKLFELDPESQAMFARANMTEQRHRLMETLGHLVAELDDPEQLIGDLVSLGKRHLVYGVRDSDYDSAGVALLWTLEHALGPEFTPEARAAWVEAYHAIASVMRRVSTVHGHSERSEESLAS